MEARPEWTVPTNMEENTKKHPFQYGTHVCVPVIHPTTGKMITKYTELARDQETREVWTAAFGREWNSLAQGGNKMVSVETNSLFVMTHAQIKEIPRDRTNYLQ